MVCRCEVELRLLREYNIREMIDFTELPEDGTRFEQFVRELLLRLGFEVHWTGVGPDGGRDLVVIEEAKGGLADFSRKWLVSCKHKAHSRRSVGEADVANVTDACRRVGATGFLLVCSTQPASSVVTKFEELTSNSPEMTFLCWDGVELERRLMTPSAFPLMHLFFPLSAKNRRWQIYASDTSPGFWSANYEQYFFYLSSRIAHSVPELTDVEKIVRRIESVPLPQATHWWDQHQLRPRAIYYDNKHEQYYVYVDYITGRGGDPEPLSPVALNEVLRCGYGLHSGEDWSSHTTYWDLRYVEADIGGDRFHADASSYYLPYMEHFRFGGVRDRDPDGGRLSSQARRQLEFEELERSFREQGGVAEGSGGAD